MAGTNPPFQVATTAHFATSVTSASASIGSSGDTAIVTNLSTGNLYCLFDGSGATATASNGYLVLPNSQRVVAVSSVATFFAAILDTGTGAVHVERGFNSAR